MNSVSLKKEIIFPVVQKHFQPCVHRPAIHIRHTQSFLEVGRVNQFRCVPNIWENIILQDFNVFEPKRLPAFIFIKVQHLSVFLLPTYTHNNMTKRKKNQNRNDQKKEREHQEGNNQGIKVTPNGSPNKAGTSTSSDSDVENTPVTSFQSKSENDKQHRKGSGKDKVSMEDEVSGITKKQADGCCAASGGSVQSESSEITYKPTSAKQPKKNGRRGRFSSNNGYSGLVNQGATCYLNSVLQTLFMTPEFRRMLLKLDVSNRAPVSFQLQKLFLRLQSQNGSATTNELTNALKISNVCEQQDAAEYYQKILSMTEAAAAAEIFQGEKKHSTICKHGNHDPVTETNSFFSLPIAMDSDLSIINVKSSFDALFEVTVMEGEDQLYCENCQIMTDMEMRCSVLKLPEVLTLHLQRFNLDYSYMIYRKNYCPVKIPLQLTVQDDSGVQHEYELYAVVNHVGSLSGGHYYADIKSFEDQRWYEFNDSRVHPIKCLRDVSRSEKACLLFFRKPSKQLDKIDLNMKRARRSDESSVPQTSTIIQMPDQSSTEHLDPVDLTVSDEMSSEDGSTDSQTAAGGSVQSEETSDTDFSRKSNIHTQTTEGQDITGISLQEVGSKKSNAFPNDTSVVFMSDTEILEPHQSTCNDSDIPGSSLQEVGSSTSSEYHEKRFSESSSVQTNSSRNPEDSADLSHPHTDYSSIHSENDDDDDDSLSTVRHEEDLPASPNNSDSKTKAQLLQTTANTEIKPTKDVDPSQTTLNSSSRSIVCQSSGNESNTGEEESIHHEESITADSEPSQSRRDEQSSSKLLQTTADTEIRMTEDEEPSQTTLNSSSGSTVCQSSGNELNNESNTGEKEQIHHEELIMADSELSPSRRDESTPNMKSNACPNDTFVVFMSDTEILEPHQSTCNDSDIPGSSLQEVGSSTSSEYHEKRFSESSSVQTNSSRNPEDSADSSHLHTDYSSIHTENDDDDDDSLSTPMDEEYPPAYPTDRDSKTKAQLLQTTANTEIKPAEDDDPSQTTLNSSSRSSVCLSSGNELNNESNTGEEELLHHEESITADSEPSQSRRDESTVNRKSNDCPNDPSVVFISDTEILESHQSTHNDSDNDSEVGAQNSSLLEEKTVSRRSFPKLIWLLIFGLICLVLLIVLILIFIVFKV